MPSGALLCLVFGVNFWRPERLKPIGGSKLISWHVKGCLFDDASTKQLNKQWFIDKETGGIKNVQCARHCEASKFCDLDRSGGPKGRTFDQRLFQGCHFRFFCA